MPGAPVPLETSHPSSEGLTPTAPLHPLASVLPSSLHPPHLGVCRLGSDRKRAPAGRPERGALSTDGAGKDTLPSPSLQIGDLQGRQDPWVPALGDVVGRLQGHSQASTTAPTPPATGPSCENGDSACPQVL